MAQIAAAFEASPSWVAAVGAPTPFVDPLEIPRNPGRVSKPKNEWEIASVRWVPGTMKRIDEVLPEGADRTTFIRQAVDEAIKMVLRRRERDRPKLNITIPHSGKATRHRALGSGPKGEG